MNLNNQLQLVESNTNNFKISNVTITDKLILIECYIQCKMWFCFYEHFIVCSGDFGEWVFDCTWETVVDGKPKYSTDLHYLLSKLSRNNQRYLFDYQQWEIDVDEWFNDWKETFSEDYYDNLTDEDKQCLNELILDFKHDIEGEYRRAKHVDDFREEFTNLTNYDFDDDYDLYEAGNIYHPYLVTNLACLLKIKEYFSKE